jgi:very-short-patch-repair endonuclease
MKLIVGSEALARGSLTRGELRWNYRPIFPDVYLAKTEPLSLNARSVGAWLWSGRRAVLTGRAAAALHGAKWVDESVPIELLWYNNHRPPGVVVRNERFAPDEAVTTDQLTVATPARVGCDLARHLPRTKAVAHLDALARASAISSTDLYRLVHRYPGARGNRRARAAIELMDAGAESPKETWLRLLLVDAKFPRPTTQIRVTDGMMTAFVDMGWEELKIGVEYDGDHHRTSRSQFTKDIARVEMLERNGWIIIRVVAENHPVDILHRVRLAFARRGSTLPSRDRTKGRRAA